MWTKENTISNQRRPCFKHTIHLHLVSTWSTAGLHTWYALALHLAHTRFTLGLHLVYTLSTLECVDVCPKEAPTTEIRHAQFGHKSPHNNVDQV